MNVPPGGSSPGFAPGKKGPIIMIIIMAVLFVALVGQLMNHFEGWRKKGAGASRPPASRPAPPTSLPSEDAAPQGTGFVARNLEWEGNLTALAAKDGEPLEMREAEHRMAETALKVDAALIADKATQLPEIELLLRHSQTFRGSVFSIRCVPSEINDYTNIVAAGRVTSWRIYAGLQRNLDEFIVFETLQKPPYKDWTLKRDVLEVDAIFVRTASYETVRNKNVTVAYFIPKSYRKIIYDETGARPGFGAVLMSRYGPMVLIGLAAFVLLTVWTLRRHSRQVEKREQQHFYGLLRSRKSPAPRSKPARS